MSKILRFIGLATSKDLDAAIQRAEKLDEYARMVTDESAAQGSIVIAGDYTTLTGVHVANGRPILVPPWVKYTTYTSALLPTRKKADDHDHDGEKWRVLPTSWTACA